MKATKRLTALALSAALLISSVVTVSAAPQKTLIDFANTDFEQAVETQPADGGSVPGFSTKIGTPTAPADPFIANSGVGYEVVDKPVDSTLSETVPGEKCLHFWDTNYKGNTTGGSDEMAVWSYARDVKAGMEYFVKVSALVKDIDDGSGGVVQSRLRYGLFFFDGNGDQIAEAAADIGRTSALPGHNPGDSWPTGFQDYQTSFVAPDGAVKARVAVWASPIYQADAYIDDIEVYTMEEEQTEPVNPEKVTVPYRNVDFEETVETQPADGGSIPGFGTRNKCTPVAPAEPMNKNTGVGYEVVAKPTDHTLSATVDGEQCLHFYDTNERGNTTIGASDELCVYSYAQDVEPNTEYTVKISAMVMDLADGTQSRIRYGLYFFDESGSEIKTEFLSDIGRTSQVPGHNPGASWPSGFQDYQTTFTSPANAAKARVAISSSPLYVNHAYIDDIEVYTMKEAATEPEIPPVSNKVQGWTAGENIIFPEQGPEEIWMGQGIGFETVAKPASMTDSVTPTGTVEGEKCLHFFDFNYGASAVENGVCNEMYLYSEPFTVTVGTEYHVALEAMVGDVPKNGGKDNGKFRFGLVFYNADGNMIGKADANLATVGDGSTETGGMSDPDMTRPVDAWKNYTKGWVAPEGAVTAKILLNTSPRWVANVFIDNMEFYGMENGVKKPQQVVNADFQEDGDPAPEVPPVSNEVLGWSHRDDIVFPQQGPSQIYEGEGIGYETVDKPVSLTGSVTPEGTVAGDKCLHFFDFNYSGSAQEQGTYNELYLYSDEIPVTAGTEYYTAMDAMVGDVPGPTETRQGKYRFGIVFFNADGTQIGKTDDYLAAVGDAGMSSPEMQRPVDSWKHYSASWTAPEGAVTAKIIINTSPRWVVNLFADNIEFYTMNGEEKQPIQVINADFSGKGSQPEIPPVSNEVLGWTHRDNIVFPQQGPSQIYEGEGIGYETVDKPASLTGSVTPEGTVAGDKCLHFFDFNYNAKAEVDGVYNELYLYSDEIEVTSGTEYYTAFEAMAGDVPGPTETRQGRFRFGIVFFDQDGSQIGKMDDYLTTVGDKGSQASMQRPVDSWKQYSASWTAPEGAVTAKIILNTTPTWVVNLFVDNVEFYTMIGGIKQSVDVTNADFSGKEPEPQPQEGVIYKTVANHDFEQPVILPEVGLVPGWIHRSGITFPEEPPTQIFQGEGIGYEITDKPASLEGSVTPAGSVAGDKCMHFYDFNYNSSAQEDGVWNEVYLYSDGLPVTEGTEYHVAFEAMVGDIPDTNETRQGRFRFGILYYDNAGNQIGLMDNYIVSVGDSASPSNMQRPVDRWKEYTSSWKAPEGAVTAKIFINTTPLWVANLFIDNMEFFTMDGDQKQQMDVNNADFSVEKQEIPVDLAPGWVLLNPVVEGTTGYEVVAKPVDLSETAGQGSALKLFDNSETEQIALASRAMPVKAGVAYQAEFDVLVSGSMQVGMLFFDAEHPIPSMDSILSRDVQTVQNSDQAAQWKTVEHRAVAPEGAAYVALVAMTETAGKAEKAFVDNVQLWYEFSGSDVQTPLYRMEDGTGVAGSVVDVAGEVVVTSVPYINAELSDKTVTVLVGLYDETGRMVAIQKKENAVMKQGTDGEILLEIEVPEVAEGSYIKTIVVDGLDTLSPVTKGRLD